MERHRWSMLVQLDNDAVPVFPLQRAAHHSFRRFDRDAADSPLLPLLLLLLFDWFAFCWSPSSNARFPAETAGVADTPGSVDVISPSSSSSASAPSSPSSSPSFSSSSFRPDDFGTVASRLPWLWSAAMLPEEDSPSFFPVVPASVSATLATTASSSYRTLEALLASSDSRRTLCRATTASVSDRKRVIIDTNSSFSLRILMALVWNSRLRACSLAISRLRRATSSRRPGRMLDRSDRSVGIWLWIHTRESSLAPKAPQVPQATACPGCWPSCESKSGTPGGIFGILEAGQFATVAFSLLSLLLLLLPPLPLANPLLASILEMLSSASFHCWSRLVHRACRSAWSSLAFAEAACADGFAIRYRRHSSVSRTIWIRTRWSASSLPRFRMSSCKKETRESTSDLLVLRCLDRAM
mmetsp:Transcript_19605/g.54715  ORF Transcript_19605/g.54715 Transcript_19605/m.54715 type:complete len:412 (+) Transcript_19605:56-1291(+)